MIVVSGPLSIGVESPFNLSLKAARWLEKRGINAIEHQALSATRYAQVTSPQTQVWSPVPFHLEPYDVYRHLPFTDISTGNPNSEASLYPSSDHLYPAVKLTDGKVYPTSRAPQGKVEAKGWYDTKGKVFYYLPTSSKQQIQKVQEVQLGDTNVGGVIDQPPGGIPPATNLTTKAGSLSKKHAKKVQAERYDYSCVMALVPQELTQQLVQWSKAHIPQQDLYIEKQGDRNFGYEEDPHITVKYGLTEKEPSAKLLTILSTSKPFNVTLGSISLFENDDYDVVKIAVHSESLKQLNKLISELPNKDEHPTYNAHLTLAYVQPGKGKPYIGLEPFKGNQVEITKVQFAGSGEDTERFKGDFQLGRPSSKEEHKGGSSSKVATFVGRREVLKGREVPLSSKQKRLAGQVGSGVEVSDGIPLRKNKIEDKARTKQDVAEGNTDLAKLDWANRAASLEGGSQGEVHAGWISPQGKLVPVAVTKHAAWLRGHAAELGIERQVQDALQHDPPDTFKLYALAMDKGWLRFVLYKQYHVDGAKFPSKAQLATLEDLWLARGPGHDRPRITFYNNYGEGSGQELFAEEAGSRATRAEKQEPTVGTVPQPTSTRKLQGSVTNALDVQLGQRTAGLAKWAFDGCKLSWEGDRPEEDKVIAVEKFIARRQEVRQGLALHRKGQLTTEGLPPNSAPTSNLTTRPPTTPPPPKLITSPGAIKRELPAAAQPLQWLTMKTQSHEVVPSYNLLPAYMLADGTVVWSSTARLHADLIDKLSEQVIDQTKYDGFYDPESKVFYSRMLLSGLRSGQLKKHNTAAYNSKPASFEARVALAFSSLGVSAIPSPKEGKPGHYCIPPAHQVHGICSSSISTDLSRLHIGQIIERIKEIYIKKVQARRFNQSRSMGFVTADRAAQIRLNFRTSSRDGHENHVPVAGTKQAGPDENYLTLSSKSCKGVKMTYQEKKLAQQFGAPGADQGGTATTSHSPRTEPTEQGGKPVYPDRAMVGPTKRQTTLERKEDPREKGSAQVSKPSNEGPQLAINTAPGGLSNNVLDLGGRNVIGSFEAKQQSRQKWQEIGYGVVASLLDKDVELDVRIGDHWVTLVTRKYDQLEDPDGSKDEVTNELIGIAIQEGKLRHTPKGYDVLVPASSWWVIPVTSQLRTAQLSDKVWVGNVNSQGLVQGQLTARVKGEGHKELGLAAGNRWRYVPNTDTVFWWNEPTEEEKEDVSSFLRKKGYQPTHHSLMIEGSVFAGAQTGTTVTHGYEDLIDPSKPTWKFWIPDFDLDVTVNEIDPAKALAKAAAKWYVLNGSVFKVRGFAAYNDFPSFYAWLVGGEGRYHLAPSSKKKGQLEDADDTSLPQRHDWLYWKKKKQWQERKQWPQAEPQPKEKPLAKVKRKTKAKADKPKEVASVVLFKGPQQVLIGLRGKYKIILPGGHLDDDETPRQAAIRETEEETSIKLSPEQLTFVGTWQYDKDRIHHLFAAELPSNKEPQAASDLDRIEWIKPQAVFQLASELVVPIVVAYASLYGAEAAADTFSKYLATHKSVRKAQRGVGKLIVFEGIDGAGKTANISGLAQHLSAKGIPVVTTKWNSGLFASAIKEAKGRKELSALLFSLVHAADMVHRYETIIKPALAKGSVVVCDRYAATSYVRDQLRGVDKQLLDQIYQGFAEPDLLIHLTVPIDVAVERITKGKGHTPSYYACGMDLDLAASPEESLPIYLKLMDRQYGKLLPTLGNYVKIQTNKPQHQVLEEVIRAVEPVVRKSERLVALSKKQAMIFAEAFWIAPTGKLYRAGDHQSWVLRNLDRFNISEELRKEIKVAQGVEPDEEGHKVYDADALSDLTIDMSIDAGWLRGRHESETFWISGKNFPNSAQMKTLENVWFSDNKTSEVIWDPSQSLGGSFKEKVLFEAEPPEKVDDQFQGAVTPDNQLFIGSSLWKLPAIKKLKKKFNSDVAFRKFIMLWYYEDGVVDWGDDERKPLASEKKLVERYLKEKGIQKVKHGGFETRYAQQFQNNASFSSKQAQLQAVSGWIDPQGNYTKVPSLKHADWLVQQAQQLGLSQQKAERMKDAGDSNLYIIAFRKGWLRVNGYPDSAFYIEGFAAEPNRQQMRTLEDLWFDHNRSVAILYYRGWGEEEGAGYKTANYGVTLFEPARGELEATTRQARSTTNFPTTALSKKAKNKEGKQAIFVDLDGTLAEYTGWKGEEYIGNPVPAMLKRVKDWLAEGKEVVIFTARANEPSAIKHIKKWLKHVGLPALHVTNDKLREADQFWDDKAVAVEKNTGKVLNRRTAVAGAINYWMQPGGKLVRVDSHVDYVLTHIPGLDYQIDARGLPVTPEGSVLEAEDLYDKAAELAYVRVVEEPGLSISYTYHKGQPPTNIQRRELKNLAIEKHLPLLDDVTGREVYTPEGRSEV